MSSNALRGAARWLLGGALLFAGTAHLTGAREEFQAQVPDWVPLDADLVVLASGIVEIGLGAALLGWRRRRVEVGLATAAFFVAIFPGNVAQYVEGTDAFGLDSDRARLIRLFFQPVLVVWALWSTRSPTPPTSLGPGRSPSGHASRVRSVGRSRRRTLR